MQVGDPSIVARIGGVETRLVGHTSLPIVVREVIVSSRCIPVVLIIEIIHKDGTRGEEAVILIEEGIVGGVGITFQVMPDGERRGADGEHVGRQGDHRAGTAIERTGPMHHARRRRINSVGGKAIVDIDAVDCSAAPVSHPESYHLGIFVADDKVTRGDHLGNTEVNLGSLIVDEEQEVDDMALGGIGGVTRHPDAHSHITQRSARRNRDD